MNRTLDLDITGHIPPTVLDRHTTSKGVSCPVVRSLLKKEKRRSSPCGTPSKLNAMTYR
jgi:hypothetical protein